MKSLLILKRNRKYIALLAALGLSLGLAACGYPGDQIAIYSKSEVLEKNETTKETVTSPQPAIKAEHVTTDKTPIFSEFLINNKDLKPVENVVSSQITTHMENTSSVAKTLYQGLVPIMEPKTTQSDKSFAQDIHSWKKPDFIKGLENGRIVSQMSMRKFLEQQGKKVDYTGNVQVVKLDNGLQAVFKSFLPYDMHEAYVEVAAYHASVELGFPYVPPTVIREIDGQKGSLQLFVDTSIDALAEGAYQKALEKVDPEEVANLKVFYFVFGQWDTGLENVLIVEGENKKHLIAIDNSNITYKQHVQYGDLPFVKVPSATYVKEHQTNDWKGTTFPFSKVQTIYGFNNDKLRETFGEKFPESFYSSFKCKAQQLKYVPYANSLWRQYYINCEEDVDFIHAYTPSITQKTKEALKKLNLETLKEIFKVAQGSEFLDDDYLQAILQRRDQVLACTKVVDSLKN